MRKYLIMFAGATFVLTGAVTKAAYLSGHPVQTKATATTLEPPTPAQNSLLDLADIFANCCRNR